MDMSDNKNQKVTTNLHGKVQVIVLSGRVTYDYMSEYKSAIKSIIQDAEGYVMDLINVTQIDSTGLGLIVNIAKNVITNKKRMVLYTQDELIFELLSISKLDKVFHITSSLEDAVEAARITDEGYHKKVDQY